MNVLIRFLFVTLVAALVVLGLTPGPSFSKTELGLHEAAEKGDLATLQKRIEMGANVNERDKDGFTPVMLAALEGQAEAINLLLGNGADINAKIEKGMLQGCSALIGAVASKHEEAARVLIEKGADIHAKLRGRYSPLVIASAAGQTRTVDLLLEKGADRTNLERDVAEWKKEEWVRKHNVQAERMQLEVALRNAYMAAQAFLMDTPKGIITTEAQLAGFGWKNYSESIVFVRADLSETSGSIVLRNKYLDETNSNAVNNLQSGEGMVDFNGERKLPSFK